MLCLFDGSSEGIAGFLVSFQLRVPYSHCEEDVLDALIDKASD
jgi:hypothetical protein